MSWMSLLKMESGFQGREGGADWRQEVSCDERRGRREEKEGRTERYSESVFSSVGGLLIWREEEEEEEDDDDDEGSEEEEGLEISSIK